MSKGILLSGGMDSVTLAYWLKPDVAFTVNYGQACAAAEIRAAGQVCNELSIRHEVIEIDCSKLGSGDLANTEPNPFAPASDWWPYRNQLLITLGAMRAIALGVNTLILGAVKTDASHADGRREFFVKMDEILSMQEGNLHIEVPAIDMTTTELVKASGIDMPLLAWSHSCHTAEYACGACRGCYKRQGVMLELGYE